MSIFKENIWGLSSNKSKDNLNDESLSNKISEYETLLSEMSTKENNKPIGTDNMYNITNEGLNSYQEAMKKDKEMYIQFFGTLEEKEALKLEQEREIENAKLQLELEKRLAEEAKEKEIQNKLEELRQKKEEEETRLNKELNRIILGYEDIIKQTEVDYTLLKEIPKSFWNTPELLVEDKIDQYYADNKHALSNRLNNLKVTSTVKNIDDEVKAYEKNVISFKEFLNHVSILKEKLSCMDDRRYSYATSIKLDKALYGMLDYIFNYVETKLVNSSYSTTIEMEPFNEFISNAYSLEISKECGNVGKTPMITVVIHSNSLHEKTVTFNSSDFLNYEVDTYFEKLFLESISKQWLDYLPYNNTKKVKGIKTKLMEQTTIYKVKENLDDWKI